MGKAMYVPGLRGMARRRLRQLIEDIRPNRNGSRAHLQGAGRWREAPVTGVVVATQTPGGLLSGTADLRKLIE